MKYLILALLSASPAISDTYIECEGFEVEKVVSDDQGTAYCEYGVKVCTTPVSRFYILTDDDVLSVRSSRQVVKMASGPDSVNRREFDEEKIKFLAISKRLQVAADGSGTTVPFARNSLEINRITGAISEFHWFELNGSSQFTGVCREISQEPKF